MAKAGFNPKMGLLRSEERFLCAMTTCRTATKAPAGLIKALAIGHHL